MTGPEHYRQAEEILRKVGTTSGRLADQPHLLEVAKVHATLALAAATAAAGPEKEAWTAAAKTSDGRWDFLLEMKKPPTSPPAP